MKNRVICLAAIVAVVLGSCAPYSGSEQEVSFTSSDGVELRGSLVFPENATRPVPVVVLFHGAEAATRSFAYRLKANIFLERGIAAFLYDKRGAGESGGNHDTASYSMFIEDALAAIAFVREQDGIDADRIGLVGGSESGWFTPEIAERAGNIVFIINKVGSVLSWRETVEWEVYNDIRDQGVDDGSAREQAALRRRMWEYYMDPDSSERAAIETALSTWSTRDDSRLPKGLRSVGTSYVQDISYDPTPYLERLSIPALYVYGLKDINIPVVKCVERIEDLQKAGIDISFHVYEEEGHELGGIGLTGYDFVEGYDALLGEFALQKLRMPQSSPG